MISFNPDTGLKELLDISDGQYTLLMKDFQIKELLTAVHSLSYQLT